MLPDSFTRPALPVFGAVGLAVPVAVAVRVAVAVAVPVAWATTGLVVPPVPASYASRAAGARAAMRPTRTAATRRLIGVLRSDKLFLLLNFEPNVTGRRVPAGHAIVQQSPLFNSPDDAVF
jgi:hypothetical protein